MNKSSLLLIHHQPRRVEKDLVDALADKVIPAVNKLIEEAAEEIAYKYEDGNLLGRDVAADELLHMLIEMLFLGDVSDPGECLQRYQMKPEYVRFWLATPTR